MVRALASVTTLVILAGGCMASPQPSLPSGVPAAKPGTAGPSGVPTETAFVLVGGSDPGFELRVPERWVEADVLFSDAQRWEGDDGAVMVSYGASIFDGGGITQCGPPTPELPACTKEAYPNSIPYDPSVDGVGPLPIDGYLRDRCVRRCHVELAATTLGGERAQRASTTIGRLRVTYVATYHARRPVIVYWSEPESAVDDARIDAMLASFRFVDPATPTQTPFVDPTELVPYQDTELGYEILSPRFWGTGTERGGVQGVREFGSGRGFGTRSFPALSISVGSTEGAVTVCQGVSHRCDVIVASELADLEASLVSRPPELGGRPEQPGREVAGDAVLAGLDARFKRPRYGTEPTTLTDFGIGGQVMGTCLGCPGMLYHVYAVHDGRPVVISIDWWTIAFNELPKDYVVRILSSFRFLE